LLYYWVGKNYRRDLDLGAGYHLNQANPLMHQIDLGDSLWAFSRTLDGRYVLAAELVLERKLLTHPTFAMVVTAFGEIYANPDISKSKGNQVSNKSFAVCLVEPALLFLANLSRAMLPSGLLLLRTIVL